MGLFGPKKPSGFAGHLGAAAQVLRDMSPERRTVLLDQLQIAVEAGRMAAACFEGDELERFLEHAKGAGLAGVQKVMFGASIDQLLSETSAVIPEIAIFASLVKRG